MNFPSGKNRFNLSSMIKLMALVVLGVFGLLFGFFCISQSHPREFLLSKKLDDHEDRLIQHLTEEYRVAAIGSACFSRKMCKGKKILFLYDEAMEKYCCTQIFMDTFKENAGDLCDFKAEAINFADRGMAGVFERNPDTDIVIFYHFFPFTSVKKLESFLGKNRMVIPMFTDHIPISDEYCIAQLLRKPETFRYPRLTDSPATDFSNRYIWLIPGNREKYREKYPGLILRGENSSSAGSEP